MSEANRLADGRGGSCIGCYRRSTEGSRGNSKPGRRGLVIKEILRVEPLIAEELEQAAVELIGAGLRHDVELPARVAPAFRAVRIGLNFELLDDLDGRLKGEEIHRRIVVVDSIEEEIVRGFARTGHIETAARGVRGALAGRYCIGNQQSQIFEIASVQRQLDDFRRVDDVA